MRLFSILFFLIVVSGSALATPGDTVRIQSHQQTHLNWYGHFDYWTVFPPNTQSFYKVLLRFTLGCPSSGCSEWDYTTQVYAKKRTQTFDSTLTEYPSFTVGNNSYSTFNFSFQSTYTTTWNSTLLETDTIYFLADSVFIFGNGLTPNTATDTILAWPCQYYYYVFDGVGNITDSIWVGCDTAITNQPWQTYQVYEIIEHYEIARLITPYNGNVSNNWTWTYTFDVTDYISLLSDSVEIRVFYGGWQDGFTATLDFEMIEGEPPHRAFLVENLWQGSFPYGNTSNPIENYLTPRIRTIPIQTDHAKFRFVPTGHGFGGNENCAEFCPKNYYFFMDGVQRGSNLIWRDNCGLNPVFPQAGTWIYDRANWCPGAAVGVFDHDIGAYLTPGNVCTLDVNMQPFTNINNNNCSYIIEGQVFYYTAPTRTLDAEMLEIIAPSHDKNHRRQNPICNNATVVIRNTGSQPLTSATIEYGVVGGWMQTQSWSGMLTFMQTDTVILNNLNDWTSASGEKRFRASIQDINGMTDNYSLNNMQESAYDIPPMYPDSIMIYFKSNSYPNENTYRVIDDQGNIVFSRSGMSANTIYRDTLALTSGCYTLVLEDSDGDGISFWANNDGSGTFRIQKLNPQGVLKSFNGDFGSSIIHHFTTGFYVGIDDPLTFSAEVFPNPTNGLIQVQFDYQSSNMDTWAISNLSGQKLIQGKITSADEGKLLIDLNELSQGMYVLMLMRGSEIKFVSKFILLPK
ncbi:MAG: T9SS type A sorting domain-containing protein [Candidatus Competibacteraceae bacterium]|nr:T9SS type A sorting domain-containing protein [Candidatus Competibacteraceae bacterium]